MGISSMQEGCGFHDLDLLHGSLPFVARAALDLLRGFVTPFSII